MKTDKLTKELILTESQKAMNEVYRKAFITCERIEDTQNKINSLKSEDYKKL